MFYGVTTNPAILEKDGQACTFENLRGMARRAFDLGCDEIQLQTWGDSTAEMASNGEELALIDSRVVVKIPITREGIKARAALTPRGGHNEKRQHEIDCSHRRRPACLSGRGWA